LLLWSLLGLVKFERKGSPAACGWAGAFTESAKRASEMEHKNWKTRLKQLGLAGIIFFTVKGTLSLLFGAWLLNKLGCSL
jgi:hypothetical protein